MDTITLIILAVLQVILIAVAIILIAVNSKKKENADINNLPAYPRGCKIRCCNFTPGACKFYSGIHKKYGRNDKFKPEPEHGKS